MKLARAVVKHRVLILILTFALMIPAVFGYVGTRVNYDMLDYLPEDMETVIGQNELMRDFGKGAISFIIVEDMPAKDVSMLKEKIGKVDHVGNIQIIQRKEAGFCSGCKTLRIFLDRDRFKNRPADLKDIQTEVLAAFPKLQAEIRFQKFRTDNQCFDPGTFVKGLADDTQTFHVKQARPLLLLFIAKLADLFHTGIGRGGDEHWIHRSFIWAEAPK